MTKRKPKVGPATKPYRIMGFSISPSGRGVVLVSEDGNGWAVRDGTNVPIDVTDLTEASLKRQIAEGLRIMRTVADAKALLLRIKDTVLEIEAD